MAHPEDLEKLLQGPKAWNAWRQEDPDHIPDLRDAELTMSQRQFGPGNGGPIDLSDADLQGMVLRNSTLTDASLVRANLVATDLVQARLDGADLTGADLTDALLDYSDLTGANFNGAILVGASLVNVTGLTQEQIAQAHGDASTALPAYLLPPENWFPALEGGLFEDYDSYLDLSPLSNDPYEVLGVERDATFDEIRTAFRALVKRLHPDLNPDDAVAQERFKRVSVAYRILGDPVKRDRYNRGEIDSNGDVRPEFEAKKEFRRYAFKFYAAAAASLILAVGILGATWYGFWTQEGNTVPGSAQTAETPPKLIERLTAQKPDSGSEQKITSVENAKPAVPPAQVAAVTSAVRDGASLDGDDRQTGGTVVGAPESMPSQPTTEEAGTEADEVAPAEPLTVATRQTAMEETPGQDAPASAKTTIGKSSHGNSSPNLVAEKQITVSSTNADAPAIQQKSAASEKSPSLPDPAGGITAGDAATDGAKQFASLGPVDATVEVSQTLSSSGSASAALVEDDENNKLATLIKDVKKLVASGPLSVPAYQPQWPSAHGAILKSRGMASPASDSISEIFRSRTKSRVHEAYAPRTATEADSLQTPRGGTAGGEFAELEFDFVDIEDFPEILIKPDAGAEFLLQPAEEESIVDTAAVEAKTGDRQEVTPVVTQTQY